MVKVEDCSESNQSSHVKPVDRTIKLEESYADPIVPNQIDIPSSSRSQLKTHFMGMGFAAALVDKVIEENGEGDPNVLLEALFTYSALQNPKQETPDEVDSPLVFTPDDDETKGADDSLDKMSYLLMMDFPEQEVRNALNNLGENASLTELADFIVDAQEGSNLKLSGKNEEAITESLFGTMDKTIWLLKMGFTEDEISSAIANFGSDASIRKLAESILDSRLGHKVIKEEAQNYSDWVPLPDEECSRGNYSDYGVEAKIPRSAMSRYAEAGGSKRTKHVHQHDERSLIKHESSDEMVANHFYNSEAASIKEELIEHKTLYGPRKNQGGFSGPPFFLYGNVVDIPRDTWRKLSQFIYNTEPEYVNSQFFSAFIRKEGYLHNLPTQDRFHILPRPPMSIEGILPHTKRCWPSWDTRKQLSCIRSNTAGVVQVCDRLGKMMMESRGVLSREQQMDILHHCKTMNLLWVGQNKLSPIEPDQVEQILGYPDQHTEIWGLETPDRLKALEFSFQTDTIGYHLSVMKGMYPDGLRVLSIFTGIGGALIALHRLDVQLKCVVAVEASEINRKILKRWWQRSEQHGELELVSGVYMLTTKMLENYKKRYGGFDIVIGSNPGCSNSTAPGSSFGIDISQFYEFVRVLQRVKSMMSSGSSRF